MPAKKIKSINLLPDGDFETSSLGRILKWALSTFRIMVIVTEMLVMGAFMSRFWLDAKNSDLNDAINVAKAQIVAYQDIEKSFRATQSKLAIMKSLYAEDKQSAVLESISRSLPADAFLISISVTGNKVQLKARTASERSIAQFISNLGKAEILENIQLSQISTAIDNDNITTFTLAGDLAPGKAIR